jgi:predicted NBD/HSP70 family sugar kinase
MAGLILCIGVDVGGTKIAAGLVDPANGQVLHALRMPTGAQRPPQEILADIAGVVARLHELSDGRATSAGIALPELVGNDGRVASTWNFDLRDIDTRLPPLVPAGMSLVLESDVLAAAMAEARFGAGHGRRSFAYVSIGTGLSYAMVVDGRPWRGANGFAIHFASSALLLPCAACGHPNEAIVENLASGKGMIDEWQRRGRPPLVGGAAGLEREAAAGDATAREILQTSGAATGSLLGQMVNMLDPEAIVLGGGIGRSAGLYRQALEAALRRTIFAEPCRAIPLLAATLDEPGVVGAALAVHGSGARP